MSNLFPYEALLFDMDGTILNSEAIHIQAIQILLQRFDITENKSNLEQIFTGLSDTATFEILKTKYQDLLKNISEIDFIQDKNHIMIELLSNINCQEFFTPGIEELLQISKQNNLQIAVVSAGEEQVVQEIMKASRLGHWFGKHIYSRASTTRSKPHPDPYFHAMKKLNILPENCLIFEDSFTGLTSALATGAKVIQVIHHTPADNRFANLSKITSFQNIFENLSNNLSRLPVQL